jgi:hypothetical protein
MSRRNQVNVIGFFLLQLQENFRQSLQRDFFSCVSYGYLMVLAIDTAQRATGEKYGSASLFPGNAGFFPHM